MKFISCSDLHIAVKAPTNRKDPYMEMCLTKLEFILKTAVEDAYGVIVVAGDFFDSAIVPMYLIRYVIELIKIYDVEILVVPGQHDMRYHTQGLHNTPLGILEAADCITLMDEKPYRSVKCMDTVFYGAGWESTETVEMDSDPFNVILVHRLVTKSGPLFPGQTDYIAAEGICQLYPHADLIVSGDNHTPHMWKSELSNININCGSMIRKSKDQVEYGPAIWLCDSETNKHLRIPIPIKPPEEVFDFNKIEFEEAKQEHKMNLDNLVETITSEVDKPDFTLVLKDIVRQAKPNREVKNIINDVMETVGGQNE